MKSREIQVGSAKNHVHEISFIEWGTAKSEDSKNEERILEILTDSTNIGTKEE